MQRTSLFKSLVRISSQTFDVSCDIHRDGRKMVIKYINLIFGQLLKLRTRFSSFTTSFNLRRGALNIIYLFMLSIHTYTYMYIHRSVRFFLSFDSSTRINAFIHARRFLISEFGYGKFALVQTRPLKLAFPSFIHSLVELWPTSATAKL